MAKTTIHGAFKSSEAANKKKATLSAANKGATVSVKKTKNNRYTVIMKKG